MDHKLRELLEIRHDRLDAINEVLLDPNSKVINAFLDVVAKYGSPEEINRKANEARKLENLYAKVREKKPEFIKDLDWLQEQREANKFISVADYRKQILGEAAKNKKFADEFAVTLEVSALQYFPWVREMAQSTRSLYQGAQDERARGRWRSSCHCGGDADRGRILCRNT